jgi:hypothetical protein
MTRPVDPRRTRRWTWLASVLSVAVIFGSCAPSSPTASPGGSGSIAQSSAPGRSSSPVPEIEADSVTKIDAAERAGTIDHDTALVDKLEAALDYASLPVEFQSSNPATPEATGILAELSTRLSSLSPELRAKVAPFFLRPSDPDSFWRKGPATTAAVPGSIRLAAISLAEYKISLIDYKYVDAAHTAVRVWYPVCSALVSVEQCHDPTLGAFVERAQQLADEIDRSKMWEKEKTAMLGHEPCTDATSANNGGDGRLDIYLVVPFVGLDWGGRVGTLDSSTYGKTLAGAAVPEAVAQPGCPATSHIILDANRDFDHLKFTAAHELFHAFQFSFKNAALGDRDWWAEASATWASDLVYPALNYEQEYLKGYWSMAGGKDEGPLDNTAGMAEYGAYLWPFYLVQKSGDASGTAVGRLWQASETVVPIQAMGQLPGWSDGFKEFALWNWNKDSVAVKYVDGSAQIPAAKLSQDTTCMLGSGKTNCLLKLGKDTMQFLQPSTTVQYYEGVPDQAVQLLKFDLTGLQGTPGLGVQAILSIGGDAGTKVEDWTGLPERTFCVKSEDLRKIVLVVSNSNVASDQAIDGKIKVEAAKVCGLPTRFVGSATATYHFQGNGVDGGATVSATGVVWQRTNDAGDYEVIAGTFEWSIRGGVICSSSGSGTELLRPDEESTIDQAGNGLPPEEAVLALRWDGDALTYVANGSVNIHAEYTANCSPACPCQADPNFDPPINEWLLAQAGSGIPSVATTVNGQLTLQGEYSTPQFDSGIQVDYAWSFTAAP